MVGINYQEYIYSPIWFDKRDCFLEFFNVCQICEKEPNQVHHLHYKTLGNEKQKDLMSVCFKCHKKIHNNKLRGLKSYWNFEKTKQGEVENYGHKKG